MAGDDKVLCYHYRANGAAVVEENPALITKLELADILEKYPNLQSSSKTIPRGAMSVDVHEKDIHPPAPGEATRPNEESNVAGVKVPIKLLLQSVVSGHLPKEMVILSSKL